MKFVIEYKDTAIIDAESEDEAWEKFEASNTSFISADLVYTYK
jgi:hypothetical protein